MTKHKKSGRYSKGKIASLPRFRVGDYVTVMFQVPHEWPGFSEWKKRLLVSKIASISKRAPWTYRLSNPLKSFTQIESELERCDWPESSLMDPDDRKAHEMAHSHGWW